MATGRLVSGALRARSWALFVAIIAVAVGRAATATPIADARPATDEDRKAIFWKLASEERAMRRDAAKSFPADLWSQDDAVHNSELKWAIKLAGERQVRLADALSAADEGLRHRWPRPADAWINPSVPPCRPRPIH
jgi:hypothetical protein